MTQSFRYQMFGLTVQSDIELPQLSGAEGGAADIFIARTTIDHPQRRPTGSFAEFGPAEQFLAWETVGAFRIPSDTRIEVDPNPGVPDALVALPLLGSVMAAVLQRRGLFVLHASAVVVDGLGVVLMGDKGAGKSTTAASILAAGHTLLADDVVAIDWSPSGTRQIMPAVGQLKLWDEAASGVGLTTAQHQGRLHPAIDKSQYNLTAGFAQIPAPLARVYVLTRAERAGVVRLDSQASLHALMQFTYLARFGQAAFGSGLGAHFQRCAELANTGQVRQLQVPNGIDLIPQAIEALLRDLKAQDV